MAKKIIVALVLLFIPGSFIVYTYFNRQELSPSVSQEEAVVAEEPSSPVALVNTPTAPEAAVRGEPEPTAAIVASSYKDGTYTVIGNYVSPGGEEEIDVTVTLAGGVVADATVVAKATRPMSKKFQDIFVENFKQFVIGKDISSLELTRVSGSSLTPRGFNEAVQEIKTQAVL